MKKILFFSPYFHPYLSGITTSAQEVLVTLATDYEVVVLTFPTAANLPATEVYRNLKIIRMPYWRRLSKGFLAPASLKIFYQQIITADLVMVNLPSVEGLALVLLAKVLGKKIISLWHCLVRPEFSSYWWLAQGLNLVTFWQLWLSDLILTYSADYLASCGWSFLIDRRTKFFEPLLIETPAATKFSGQLSQAKGQQKWLGFVGRISREKGLLELIAGIEAWSKKTQIPYQLVLAGPSVVAGEDDYQQAVLARLKTARINYRFWGQLSSAELTAFYQHLDVLLISSTHQTEALSLAQIEAQLAGVPVIATNLPGVRLPVKWTGLGQIINQPTPESWVQALTNVLAWPATKRRDLTHRARQVFNQLSARQKLTQLIYDFNR